MIDTSAIKLCAEELFLPDGPRWHGGELYFSDMLAGHVSVLGTDGSIRKFADVEPWPLGLGWLSGGELVAVSMRDKSLRIFSKDGAEEAVVELGDAIVDKCNDMSMHPGGWAYVGSLPNSEGATPADRVDNCPISPLVKVDLSDRSNIGIEVVVDDMHMVQGIKVTPDGTTLIVGETAARRLVAFDIGLDGNLSNRRTWADLPGRPGKFCLDSEGAAWVAMPLDKPSFVRVREGGEIVDSIDVSDGGGFACELGGEDLRTLFLMEASNSAHKDKTSGRIRCVEVPVPGVV
ncbi:SMP-30/gluconolactonase/LRE family protein [Novosphingobium malaysiense]|uniref:SMP-30/gluconolactonase/LRE family protein n=1 Tax=Novosphingobium malaysiense TaxID=1348853 RepID=UPI00068B4BB3|nr:SMP-30/gluconolactonase/LRE family protein [Novosphingobium malaysiense]